jgi:MFS transporter, UMF1 family
MEMLRDKTIRSWALYDWANSAFATTIMAAVFPPFYRSLVLNAGFSGVQATAFWGYTAAGALLIVAVIGPILGAFADQTGSRKRLIACFAGLGILGTAGLAFLGTDAFWLGSLLFTVGNIGFACGNIFYESLLPHIADEKQIDRVSTLGYALGYVGGGILLLLNVFWILSPEWFGLPNADSAIRLSLFSVAVWWTFFSIPFFRNVTEPVVPNRQMARVGLRESIHRLIQTVRSVRRYRELGIFLIAFWIYNDGIGTIIKMATAYGDEIGIGMNDMITALVIMQFVGIPCAFGFGRLAEHVGARRAILVGLSGYVLISIAGFFMQTATHFYILALMVGMVQGGTQALSRSLYASMVPKSRSAEFFGFYSTSSRFAGIVGPLLFGVVAELTGGSRLSILSLIAFFAIGGFILTRVDEEEGRRIALEDEITHPAGPTGC